MNKTQKVSLVPHDVINQNNDFKFLSLYFKRVCYCIFEER